MQMPFIEMELLLQPWKANPHQLVTWWDMLSFSAWNFFWCGTTLRSIELDCLMGSIEVPGIEDVGSTPIFNLPRDLDGFCTEEQAERIFENVKGFMKKLAERLSE